MKNIFEILESVGVALPEEKRAEFTASFNENYKTVSEAEKLRTARDSYKAQLDTATEKLRTARDSYKAQLDTATEKLKGFEGVDVSELQSRISTLTAELDRSKADFDERMAQRDFDDRVSSFAQKYKVRDIKAVLPFLDTEKLKSSKNRDADIDAAFQQVKKDKAYLFDDDTAPRVISYTSGPDKTTNDTNTKANEALRQLFGKD